MTIEARAFRNALGCFATGITVVTTRDAEGAPAGVTISSFTSVSLEPPLVLFCLALDADTRPALEHRRRFVVHVLAEGQESISNRFARTGVDKWADLEHDNTDCGLPLISGALATFTCAVTHMYEGGDHVIIVGHVEAMQAAPEGEPLLYVRGRYRHLKP
ncbi:MAG: flavin reductase family protein [Myxococcota bacterium]